MAGHGGGAWKVAYADFVTAMMAFFLVMWICGQDQKIRRAVSYYFNDPHDTSMIGNTRQPNRTGSVADNNQPGSVPMSEAIALGRGRKAFSSKGEKTPPTRMVSNWLSGDDGARKYWEERADRARQWAAASDEVREQKSTIDEAAAVRLAKHLRNELGPEIASKATGLQQDLLFEVTAHVNWHQIAEDLLSR